MLAGSLEVQLALDIAQLNADMRQAASVMSKGTADMAQAAQQAANAVGAIGTAAAPAAQKVDFATRSMINSIQQATAAMEAGGRSTSAYFEKLAAQRGLAASMQPYIDQLKQAEKAAQDAGHGMEELSFKTSAAKRELLVLVHELSQGNFKRFGASLLVLGERTGAAALLFSSTTLALLGFTAGIAAFAVAAGKGANELKGFQDAATVSGNAMGMSASQFTAARDALAEIGVTKAKAAEALTEIAKTGLAAGMNVNGIAQAAILMERATGEPIEKTVKQFEELGKSPAEASAKLNEQYNYLTASVYDQIKALEDQGKKQQAAQVAEEAYASALTQRAQEIIGNQGSIERGWHAVANAAKSAWDAMLDIGRKDSLGDQLAKAVAQLDEARARLQNSSGQFSDTPGGAAVGGLHFGASGRARAQADAQSAAQNMNDAQRRLEIEGRNAQALADQAAQTKARIDWDKQGVEFLTKRERMEREIAKAQNEGVAAGATQLEIQKRISEIRQKYTETHGERGIATQNAAALIAQEENRRMQASIDSLDFSQPVKMTEAEKKVLEIQEELKGSLMGVARANKEKELSAAQAAVADEKATQVLQKQYEATKLAREEQVKQAQTVNRQAEAIRQHAIEQEGANATMGKTKTAIEQTVLAQLKLQAAEADATDTFDPKYVAGLNAKVEAQQRYVAALQEAEYVHESRKLDEEQRQAKEETDTIQLQVDLLGKTKEQRDQILAQRKAEVELAKQLAEIDRLNLGDGPDAAAKREELKAKARATAEIKAQDEASKTVLNAWEKSADSIDKSLTDALMHGFDSGKSFAQNLADEVKRMFETLVLRPVIQAVFAPASGTLAGIGQQIGGSMMGGGFGNFASLGSTLGSLSSGGGIIGSIGGALGLGGGVGGSFASTVGGGLATDAMGATVAEGSAAATLGGGSMAAIGAAMPYLALGLAAASALGLFSGGHGPKTESGFGYGIDRTPNPGAAQAIAQGIQQQYASMAASLGTTPGNLDLGVFTAQDPNGTAKTQLQVAAALNGNSIYNRGARLGGTENVGRSDAELQSAIAEETQRVVLEALQQSGLTGAVGDYLKQLGNIDQLSGGDLSKAMTHIQQAQSLETTLFDLTSTDEEKLAKKRQQELAGLDDLNKVTAQRIYALQDEATAEQKASNAIQKAIDSAKASTTFLAGVNTSIQQFLGKLNTTNAGGLPPEQQLANARAQFDTQLTLARLGNRSALQGITGYADQLAQAQTAYTASGSQTQDTLNYIRQALSSLPGVQSPEEYLASTIKDAINNQTSLLQGALDANFSSLDTNVDGLLDFNELKSALGPMATDDQIRALIARVDTNGDGMISKAELLNASVIGSGNNTDAWINWSTMANIGTTAAWTKWSTDTLSAGLWGTSGYLATKFDTLDTTANGLLDFNELKAALGPIATDDQIRAMIAHADTNGDGQISKEEAIKAAVDINTVTTAAAAQAQIQAITKPQAVVPTSGTNTIRTFADAVASGTLDPLNPFFYTLPSYDVGTPFVPSDGPAYLHYGERVLTREENVMFGAGGSSAQGELQAMRGELQKLTAVVSSYAQRDLANGAKIETNTSATARATKLAAAQAPV